MKRKFCLCLSLLLSSASILYAHQHYRHNCNASSFNWDQATVYFVYIDRFFNGNNANDFNYNRKYDYGSPEKNAATFHGGDIVGLTKKLRQGYFKKLGVNVIWITGVYEQIHGWIGGGSLNDFPHYAYHGYYPMDFTMIDKNYGTIEEFRSFVNMAHRQGMRIVMDVGINHPGYATLLDRVQFKFGDLDMTEEEAREHIEGNDYIEDYNFDIAYSWESWWGTDWIRTPDEMTGDVLTESIFGLPDFKTESTMPVDIPFFLQEKWSESGSETSPWTNPSAVKYRKNLGISQSDYVIAWVAAWVEEFGIDGFRCDVLENVDTFRWKELSEACNAALTRWRNKYKGKPGTHWDESFWMTGDIWGADYRCYEEYQEVGFNSIVNFQFPKNGNLETIGAVWQEYADYLNNRDNWSTLSFLNNTYKRETDPENMKNCGTTLLLSPGPVQIFYGDEVARKVGAGTFTSDVVQGYRSDYDWNHDNYELLRHWQILGKFRKRHKAVAMGKQITIEEGTYGRIFEKNQVRDKVVICLKSEKYVSVNVSGFFRNGSIVRNAYTGEVSMVRQNKVRFQSRNNVILIEQLKKNW